MRNRMLAAVMFGVVFACAGAARADEAALPPPADANELMRRADRLNRSDDETREAKMTLINKNGTTRERRIIIWTKRKDDDNDYSLVRFIAPGDVAGTGLLTEEFSDRDDDQFLYLPALKRTRRISSSDKSDSFMGTDFSFEDMEAFDEKDWDHKKLGEETHDGRKVWIVESVPKSPKKIKETAYGKIVGKVDPERYIVLASDYFNKKDEHIKEFKALNIKPYGKLWRAERIEMRTLKSGHTTTIEYSDTKINTGLEVSRFTRRELEKN